MASARESDINGFVEIKGNPISKVGVFPYSGAQISDQLDPETIYMVYRPAEELNNAETIASFRLLPWTDDHAMLGSTEDGLTPAERKGVHGVVGENVYFEAPYLKANLKVFSEDLAKLIDDGKRELSIGYHCLYDIQSGVYDGIQYDAIQRSIRGNHLALVEEGRSGADVAVLDHFKITLDAKGLTMPKATKDEDLKKKEGETAKDDGEMLSLESLAAKVDALAATLGSMQTGASVNKVVDAEPDMLVKREDTIDESEEEEKKEEKKDSMDAKLNTLRTEIKKDILKETSQKSALVEKLSQHIGTFDHADKTLAEVVSYGVKALKLTCDAAHESAMLDGYLAGAKVSAPVYALDSVAGGDNDQITEFLNGSV